MRRFRSADRRVVHIKGHDARQLAQMGSRKRIYRSRHRVRRGKLGSNGAPLVAGPAYVEIPFLPGVPLFIPARRRPTSQTSDTSHTLLCEEPDCPVRDAMTWSRKALAAGRLQALAIKRSTPVVGRQDQVRGSHRGQLTGNHALTHLAAHTFDLGVGSQPGSQLVAHQ